MRAPALLLAALSLALASVTGCSSAASGPLVLSWQLADGRDCATAGAMTIEARTSSSLATMPLASFACSAGFAPASVTLADVPGSGTLFVDARDSFGIDLYRGTLSLDDDPPGTGAVRSVTLVAVAAE